MSTLVIPKAFGIRSEEEVKKFTGIGIRLSVPMLEAQVTNRVQSFLSSGNIHAIYDRVQIRVEGAPAHPTHPGRLMRLMEFMREDGAWVPAPEFTEFTGLQDYLTDQIYKTQEQKATKAMKKAAKKKQAKEESPVDSTKLTKIPASPVFDDIVDPETDETTAAQAQLVVDVMNAATEVLGNSKPITLGDQTGYLTDLESMAALNLAIIRLSKSPLKLSDAPEEE